MIILDGGEFFNGWMANMFGLPFDGDRHDAWIEGWRMAEETARKDLLGQALLAEVKLQHIKVTER